jgi:hypothetical protein
MSNLGFRRRPRPRTVFCALLALAVSGAAALQAASTGFGSSRPRPISKGDDAVSIDTDGGDDRAAQVLGDVGTPAVWRIAAAHGQICRHRPRRQAVELGAGPPKVVFDARNWTCRRSLPGRRRSWQSGRRPTARSIASRRTARRRSSIPRTAHLGDRGGAGRHHIRRHRRQGGLQGAGRGRRRHAVLRHRTEHVSALAFDGTGMLLVGTSTPGRVVRLDAEGKPFVILRSRLPGGAQPPRRRRRHLRHGRGPRDRRHFGDRRRPPPTPAPRSRCRPR